jgi:thioredoxin-dependent peroxiredoxin
MKLKEGQKAPHFRIKDVFGRTIDLADYSGGKVHLAFFRHAGCPFCNLHVHALTRIHEETKSLGLDMIFFFESKETVILRSSFHKGVSPIPLISDPQKIWYSAYGLENSFARASLSHVTSFISTYSKARAESVPVNVPVSESFSTMPAEFLIGKDNITRRVLYSAHLNERLEPEEIRQFAKSAS